MKDLLRLAADTLKESEGKNGLGNLLGRADKSESDIVPQLLAKLVTQSMQAQQEVKK